MLAADLALAPRVKHIFVGGKAVKVREQCPSLSHARQHTHQASQAQAALA